MEKQRFKTTSHVLNEKLKNKDEKTIEMLETTFDILENEEKNQIEIAKRIIEVNGDCREQMCNKGCPFEEECTDTGGNNEEFAEILKDFVEKNSGSTDNVNSPNHYKLNGLDVEVIDVIRASMSPEEFKGYCKGNVIKYVTRENKKNGMEDLRKAKKYLEYAIGE